MLVAMRSVTWGTPGGFGKAGAAIKKLESVNFYYWKKWKIHCN